MTPAEVERLHLQENADSIKVQAEKRKVGYVSKAQEEILADTLPGPKKGKKKTPLLTKKQNRDIVMAQERLGLQEFSREMLEGDQMSASPEVGDTSSTANVPVQTPVKASKAREFFDRMLAKKPPP